MRSRSNPSLATLCLGAFGVFALTLASAAAIRYAQPRATHEQVPSSKKTPSAAPGTVNGFASLKQIPATPVAQQMIYAPIIALDDPALAELTFNNNGTQDLATTPTISTLVPNQRQMPPAPLVAPLFVESEDFTSVLVLVNPTTKSAAARVVLRNLQGETLITQRVTVAEASRLDVSIGEMLRSIASSETTGSVVVMRDGKNIAAALSLTDSRQGSPSYLDEELAMPMPTSSPMLRSVAEGATGSPIVSITSVASTMQHVTIRCLPEHGPAVSRTVNLLPNATVLSRTCAPTGEPAAPDFGSMANAPDQSAGRAFGIELSSDGPAGGFAAFGLADHRSSASEYFSTTVFDDPMMKKSSTAVFAGVPVGNASQLPSGTYTPLLGISNFGAQTANVTVTLATMSGDSPKTRPVVRLQIRGGQSKLLKLQGLNGDERMQNSFLVKSDAPPGEVFTKLSAVSDGPLHEVELLGKDAESGYNGGGHPWSIANGNESTLILFNESPDSRKFNVAIGYGNGKAWQKQYTLTSMQTLAIGIRELIEGHVKDDRGNEMPVTLTQGDVMWNSGVNAGQGRLLESNSATAMARSFSCYYWYFLGAVFLDGPSAVGLSRPFSEVSSYETDVDTDDINECFASYSTTQSLNLTYSWSFDSSIFQGDDCGSGSDSCGLTGYTFGQSGSISVTLNDGTCPTLSAQTTVSVVDITPVLTGINPSDWTAGTTTQVTFTGQYFGTNAPTLSFSPGTGISYTLSSYNDTQIVASVTVASGTPDEQVTVSVTNNGYGGSSFSGTGAGESPTSPSVYATVHSPMNTPEITVIGWINGQASDLANLPTGANSTLINNLNSSASSCGFEVFEWSVLQIRADLQTSTDQDYANAWLLKHSANSAPPNPITPSVQQSGGDFRVFNDFGNGGGFYQVGATPDPCGAVPTSILNWVNVGEASQYSGATGTSPSGQVYQLVEGRIGKMGQRGSQTINNGRTVPWIWSVIEFDSSGNPTYSDVGMFPTYSVYRNGYLVATYPQSPAKNFIANDQTYQRTPSQIQ